MLVGHDRDKNEWKQDKFTLCVNYEKENWSFKWIVEQTENVG